MKAFFCAPKVIVACFAMTVTGPLFVMTGHGQTVVFDVASGSGSFNTSPFYDTSLNADHPFINGEQPLFNKAAGLVTVDAPVILGNAATSTPPVLEVATASGSTQTFGAVGTTNSITFNVPQYGATLVQIDTSNTSDVFFNAPLVEVETTNLTYDTGFANFSEHNVTYNSIAVTGTIDTATNYVNVSQAGSGMTTITGAVTNTTGNNPNAGQSNPFLRFGANGPNSPTASYVLASTASVASNVGIGVNSGTLYVQTSNIGNTPDTLIALGSGAAVLTDAAGVNIGVGTIYTGSNDTIGGHGAFDTSYSANIANYNGPTTLTSDTAGGIVHFTGTINQNNGIIVTGPGIVSLENGNSYNGTTTVSSGAKLLLNNPTNLNSGSATGVNTIYTAAYNVGVDSGGLLGGTGSSARAVVAAGPSSTFSPGNMTSAGVSQIGTLTLAGGLTANNGLTMNFDLNGTDNDAIDFANAMMTLSGVVTINLTGTPTPDTGSGNFGIFTLLANIGVGSTSHGLSVDTLGSTISTDPAIIINAPTGYVVESSGYYPDNGSASGDSYYVQLEVAAVPEPSTYAMFFAGLGMLALMASRRRRLAL